MKFEYKLSAKYYKRDDKIAYNVYHRKNKLFYNIKSFARQPENNGIFAENILRLILDGVNLNHLSKNHPHVDIAVINEIPGVAKQNEVISVKSSTRQRPTLASVIGDSKAIKLESMFSYILYADSDYRIDYQEKYFKPKQLLKNAISAVYDNERYREAINIVLYYLFFKNESRYKSDFDDDLKIISQLSEHSEESRKRVNGRVIYKEEDIDLAFGQYSDYAWKIVKKIAVLNNPISLGVVYLENRDNNLTCVIKKTNDIKVSRYWQDLVEIWIDESHFASSATKYLNESKVKELFKINDVDDFPIEIRISIDGYVGLESSVDPKTRTDKLYIATKFKDAEFKDNEPQVNNFFLKAINILERRPVLVRRFNDFIKTLK